MNRKQIMDELKPALEIFQHVNNIFGLYFNEVKIVMDKGGSRIIIDTSLRGQDKWDNIPYNFESEDPEANKNYKS